MLGFRVGIGYDLHQLQEGETLTLGGIEISHTHGLVGHSDADCLTHAIIDALLGAAGLPDIGNLFPDYDPKFENIDSQILLREVRDELKREGFKIVNVDTVVIAEAPRIYPHREEMRQLLAKNLGIGESQINVKATTNEKMDAIGQKKAIAAQAICLLES